MKKPNIYWYDGSMEGAPDKRKLRIIRSGEPEEYIERPEPLSEEVPRELRQNERRSLRNALMALGVATLSMKGYDEPGYETDLAPQTTESVSEPERSEADYKAEIAAALLKLKNMEEEGIKEKFNSEPENESAPLFASEDEISDTQSTITSVEEVDTTNSPVETSRSPEGIDEASQFFSEVTGYYQKTQLHWNEVQFVDEERRPVGEPHSFETFVVDRVNDKGEVYQYALGPGIVDENGLPTDGIAKEWLEYVRAKLEQENPGVSIVTQYNVVQDFKAALSVEDEPELRARIIGAMTGEESVEDPIDQYQDIIYYYAEKPVSGDASYTRAEYVREYLQFRTEEEDGRPRVPQIVQEKLRELFPGLIAYESRFRADVTSGSGAEGLAQIMPATYEGYMGTREVSRAIEDQTYVSGRLFSDDYHYLLHFAGEEALKNLRNRYDSEEAFLEELMVPLVIEAYNGGGPFVGNALQKFIEKTLPEELQSGYDLFIQFVDFAASDPEFSDHFKERARGYVPNVYAHAQLFDQTDSPEYVVAQN